MEQNDLLEKLEEKISRIASIEAKQRFSPEYKKWHRETNVLLRRAFGVESYQLKDFIAINYVYRGARVMGDSKPLDRKFYSALKEARAILTSIKEEILEFGIDEEEWTSQNPVYVINQICSRFHVVVRQLRKRHSSRPTLDIDDEYDVQDLLHALLRIYFLDVRPEEWTPSYGGNSSRMDFLLKTEQIVIEVKMTRKSMTDQNLVDQLIIDAARYENHPDCKSLICFVYDPDGRIANPVAITSDLESAKSSLPVRILIYPSN